ncbi:hypothetical protein [Undibacterium flavidum]|uniref:Uncharacterized protein n=1 Tax=Undibacterium flavidum TaxID=2762297 RepID=A0ABR6YES3_9BURK|nr:hypothetical protein [Undibacterium flavidum]MBC3875048.1 hypothetical protein [Undibacterium flavidum]
MKRGFILKNWLRKQDFNLQILGYELALTRLKKQEIQDFHTSIGAIITQFTDFSAADFEV